jgi:hypothetical protein
MTEVIGCEASSIFLGITGRELRLRAINRNFIARYRFERTGIKGSSDDTGMGDIEYVSKEYVLSDSVLTAR